MKDVENYIRDILKTRKLHFTLIDPDEQTPEEALDIATQAIEGGSDGIMIDYHFPWKYKQREQLC